MFRGSTVNHSRLPNWRSVWALAWSCCCVCVFSGCAQFVLLGFLLGGRPSIEPDFDKQTGEALDLPEVTVAVTCFAPTDMKLDYPKVDSEVAMTVALRLRQNGIKVIIPDVVRAWQDENPDWEHPEEIGAALEATHVIEIELASFDLYERNSTNLYRGRTEAYVNVFKMDESGTGDRIYSKELNFEFPTAVPRPADLPLQSFKVEYLSRLSDRIGFLFYPRENGDMIPWAS